MRGPAFLGLLVGTLAALAAMFWPGPDLAPSEVTPPVVATSPLAPATSPRPQARECAGTVTNNPAIQDWRRSIGC